MKITLRQDLVGSLIFLILSLVLWWLMPSQIVIADDEEIITAQTFPRLIIGLMAICSLILLIKELIKWVRKQPTKTVEIRFVEEMHSAFILLSLVIYWGLLHWLPFMVSSILFAFLLLAFFRCKNWKYYATVAIFSVLLSLFFQNLLHISLP